MRRELEMNLPAPRLPGKDRPRYGGGKRPHTTGRNREYRELIGGEWARRVGTDMAGYSGEFHIRIEWQDCCPKSVRQGLPATVKPYVDNAAKLVMDALNGVAYRDDAQATLLIARKHRRFRRKLVYLRIVIDYKEA